MRFDTLLYEGYAIPPFYDSLLGKLIAGGDTRADALARLRSALGALTIEGVPTTRELHLALLDDETCRPGLSTRAGSGLARLGRIDAGQGRLRGGGRHGDENPIFVRRRRACFRRDRRGDVARSVFQVAVDDQRSPRQRIKGVTEICPANASLQVRFDPDVISPNDMLAELKRLESRPRRRIRR